MSKEENISKHAQALSAEGASKGGKARANSLTPEVRREIAQHAAEARWGGTVPRATHSGFLEIGGNKFACAVLENGTRLLTQRDFLTAIGRSAKPAGKKSTAKSLQAEDPPPFLVAENLRPFISENLLAMYNPIAFRNVRGARALGYDAKILPLVCDAYLQARDAHRQLMTNDGRRLLTEDQERIAAVCEMLVRGLAQVGIVALIDEATGYQAVRERDELSRILAAYINEELRPWIGRFPNEFFKQIYRLYQWKYIPGSTQSPRYIGKLINKWIYEQLPSGVLPTLQEKNPVTEKGYRKYKHFQFLTEGTGVPHLDKQIAVVTMLMRISSTKDEFERNFNKAFGKPYQEELSFDTEEV